MQCKSLRESVQDLAKYDVAVFGASTDSLKRNKKFADQLKLNYPLLSDVDRRTAKAYGILVRGKFASRSVFIIGKDGKIAHIEKKVDVRNHGKQLLRLLENKIDKKLESDGSAKKDHGSSAKPGGIDLDSAGSKGSKSK